MDWTLADGLDLIRVLQPSTREYGYHLTLGGSVLNTGLSKKDLDLYFLPLVVGKEAKGEPEKLLKWLQKMWGPGTEIDSSESKPGAPTPAATTYRPVLRDRPAEDPLERAVRHFGEVRRAPVEAVNLDAPFMEPPPIPADADGPGDPGNIFRNIFRAICLVPGCRNLADLGSAFCTNHYKYESLESKEKSGGPQGIYKYKYKFIRGKSDRIDVFILG